MEGVYEERVSMAEVERVPVVRAVERFEAFYAREFEAVAALAVALSGSRIVAEDLAQEAFLAAYREWDRVGRFDNPGAWVRRVVANRSVSVFRRRVAEARALTRLGGRGDDRSDEVSGEGWELWGAVRKLPKRQAQTVALFYVVDMTLEDIALVLGCTVVRLIKALDAVNLAALARHPGEAIDRIPIAKCLQ